MLFSKGYSLRPIVWHACLEAGFTPKIAFEGEETDTIRGLVAAGMGVSLLPEMALFQTNPLRPARVRISEPKVTRSIGLIHRADEKRHRLLRHSVRFCFNILVLIRRRKGRESGLTHQLLTWLH